MRQTARQCPLYISFIEKHSQIKIVEKWVDTAQRGSTIQMGDNRRFFHVACFTTQLPILPVNFRYLGNCGILSLGKGSYVWTSHLCCLRKVPCQTQLLLSSSCWVRQQCFEDCKFSTFPSCRCWRVVHCGRASLGGNHLVNQAAACRSPGARAAHPSQTLSASLSHSRWTFRQFGKNMQKLITLSTPIYHPAIFSHKSEKKKTGQIGNNRFIRRFLIWATVCWTQSFLWIYLF